MKKAKILPFIYSLLISFLIFFGTIFLCINPASGYISTEEKVSEPYSAEISKHLGTKILLCIKDFDLNFILSINSFKSEVNIFTFSSRSVKNSTEYFDTLSPKASCYNFFGVNINKIIYISKDTLTNIVNSVGGISIIPKYGFKSPSNENIIISYGNEREQIYGESVLQILKSEAYPDYDMQLYFSEIFSNIVQKVINSLDEEFFNMFLEKCETDISFANYVDNKETLKLCIKNISFDAAKGVWLNNNYFLQ